VGGAEDGRVLRAHRCINSTIRCCTEDSLALSPQSPCLPAYSFVPLASASTKCCFLLLLFLYPHPFPSTSTSPLFNLRLLDCELPMTDTVHPSSYEYPVQWATSNLRFIGYRIRFSNRIWNEITSSFFCMFALDRCRYRKGYT